MRRLMITGVVALFGLSLAVPAWARDKQKQEPVKVQPAAPKQTAPAPKPEAAVTQEKSRSVDRFIDKDNDGVDDRRERKVVREPKPKTAKPEPRPEADPNRERTTAKQQAPPR
jgi:hypothetical protein